MEQIDRHVQAGLHAAGFMSYEAGLALEPRLRALERRQATAMPLLWFGLFERAQFAAASWVQTPLPVAAPRLALGWTKTEHSTAVYRVLDHISAGDCYQVNLTFPSVVSGVAKPFDTYLRLRKAQQGGWGGYINTGSEKVLSCSPELFFTKVADRLSTKPMKGTALRSADPLVDNQLRDQLNASVKDRAENLMIVDLLRNDLAKIAVPGTVSVPRLFEIERYPTVHQMTSTIHAYARPGVSATDVLRAMFPCGSVTGAPKIKAMEIIHSVEKRARGIYTGSMGFIEPGGMSAFNVLIRTIEIDGYKKARLGLGSAIVADSNPLSEWRECAAKAAFIRY